VNWAALFKSSLTLFAIVNPVGSIPIFIQLTARMAPPQRRRAFRTGVLSAAAILFIFVLAGDRVLTDFFRIELADLMAAGGLLLLIIAIDHLVFGSLVRSVLSAEKANADHVGAVPIACPILAGPGAMMTVLLTYSEHGPLVAVLSVLVVIGLTWLILRFIEPIYRFIGETVCLVLSKILCLFIAAIGMRLLMQGLSEHLK
jgi:multiple antibiotic resistance protein